MSSAGKVCFGKITKLYVHSKGVYIEAKNEKGTRSKDDYYLLSKEIPNYDGMLALAMLAAQDGKKITLRTREAIEGGESAAYPSVIYLTVDF